jgi:hypothetical protein
MFEQFGIPKASTLLCFTEHSLITSIRHDPFATSFLLICDIRLPSLELINDSSPSASHAIGTDQPTIDQTTNRPTSSIDPDAFSTPSVVQPTPKRNDTAPQSLTHQTSPSSVLPPYR